MNTRMTFKNHVNIWTYALPTLCLLQFLWALSPKKALGPRESEDRHDDDFGSKTAKERLRNGWVAATALKTTSIFKTIGVLTRYQTSALKVYWSSSLSAPRIWAPDCNISIENLEYQMIRSQSYANSHSRKVMITFHLWRKAGSHLTMYFSIYFRGSRSDTLERRVAWFCTIYAKNQPLI